MPIRGLRYGPFRSGQDPNSGIFPSEAQIAQDIAILAEISDTIGTYSLANGLYRIVELASATGDLKVAPTAWLARETGVAQEGANTEELPILERLIIEHGE